MKKIKSINIGDVFYSRHKPGVSIKIIEVKSTIDTTDIPRKRFIVEYFEYGRLLGSTLYDYEDIVDRYCVEKEEDKNSFNKRCIIEKSQPEELPF